jgi:large conductance mechanosensitive channel
MTETTTDKAAAQEAARSKTFFEEFRDFAIKGNVIDLAVAVVVGAAFNKIVDSLVNDVIMQAIAMIFGKPDFASFMLGSIKIGSFINSIVNFLIVAFSIFLTIRFMRKVKIPHRLRREAPAPAPEQK